MLAVLVSCKRDTPPEPPSTTKPPTAAQISRQQRSEASIREEGLPVPEGLSPIADASQTKLRTSEAVAQRAIAAIIAATKATNEDPALPPMLVERFEAKPFLSSEEAAFLAESQPSAADRTKFARRFEDVHVLLWAIGYLRELLPPNEPAQVEQEVSILRDKGAKSFVEHAKLRPADEIVEQLDFYYRAHATAVELRKKNAPSEKLNEGIVAERHRALKWITRHREQDWDRLLPDEN